MRFSIVGPGRVGCALGRSLVEAGWTLLAVASRDRASAQAGREWIGSGRAADSPADAAKEAEVVFITTPDSAIEPVCRRIAEVDGFASGAVVLHTSGALPSSVLSSARDCGGCAVGSAHPLQSFATPEEALRLLPGTCFCLEGDAGATEVAERMVEILGGRHVSIAPEAKTLYHAGACVASNYLVTLTSAAVDLFQRAGIARETALEMLLPLIRGTVSNLEQVGLPDALTGPIARGDELTVRQHKRALREQAPELLPLYELMAALTQRIADQMNS